MLEQMPPARLSPVGFQAAANVSALNHSQPAIDRKPTGMMTPQTVIEPIRPVSFGQPKLAAVVSHSSPMTPMQVAIGVADSHGTNAAR